jgi:predicted  nucleic acid-binding Zn-ribbon protein
MPFLQQMFECAECGAILGTNENNELSICKECGSASFQPITGIKEQLKFIAKKTGASGKPDFEVKIADDLHKKTNEWRQLKMTIDRINDLYEKRVINPETDEELYYNKEPLSCHQGRGSAKQKSKNTDGNDKP